MKKKQLINQNDKYREQIDKYKNQQENIKTQQTSNKKNIIQLENEINELNMKIKNIDKNYNLIKKEKDNLNQEINDKSEEINILKEKLKLLQTSHDTLIIQHQNELKQIKNLNKQIEELKNTNQLTNISKQLLNNNKQEINNLKKSLIDEQNKVKTLTEELENPINIHRWRNLEGNDPTSFDLIQKLKIVQKKLIEKTEESVKKNILIDVKTKECEQLQKELNHKFKNTNIQDINNIKQKLREKETLIKSLTAEISMYQDEHQPAKSKQKNK